MTPADQLAAIRADYLRVHHSKQGADRYVAHYQVESDADAHMELVAEYHAALLLDFCARLAAVERLREALNACVVFTQNGQPCYRTSNGVPQAMPKRSERIVRAALAGETPKEATE